MTSLPADDRLLSSANRTVLRKLAVMAVVMFGFGFALVPFYEKICQVAGIRNVFQPDRLVSENTQVDLTRKVSIEFADLIDLERIYRRMTEPE
jgi:cytochrome c oxidase assembly protein subunit 11